jgi:predicted nucleotidyltransferase
VRDDFGPDSDIDVMVRFDPERAPPGLLEYSHVQLALQDLLGRKVDMIERGPITNPYARRFIRRDLTVVYAA